MGLSVRKLWLQHPLVGMQAAASREQASGQTVGLIKPPALLVPAGIWRRKTIVTVGGWKSRTTVEDMDLSLRTYVNGWKAIYLTDTTCINEVGENLCEPHSAVLDRLLAHVHSRSSQQAGRGRPLTKRVAHCTLEVRKYQPCRLWI